MIYVLELTCDEDDCLGKRDCNQIYYLFQLARSLTTEDKHDHWIKLAELVSCTRSGTVIIQSEDNDDNLNAVKIELRGFEGCYDSFSEGFKLWDDELDHEYTTHRFILLPKDFKPIDKYAEDDDGDDKVFNDSAELLEYTRALLKQDIPKKKPRMD